MKRKKRANVVRKLSQNCSYTENTLKGDNGDDKEKKIPHTGDKASLDRCG